MAIDTTTLKSDLKDIFSKTNDAETAAKEIAEAFEKWIKTADVTVTAQPMDIQVSGTATSQTNINPIVLNGKPYAGSGGIT